MFMWSLPVFKNWQLAQFFKVGLQVGSVGLENTVFCLSEKCYLIDLPDTRLILSQRWLALQELQHPTMHLRLVLGLIQKALCGFAMSRLPISGINHHLGKEGRAFWEWEPSGDSGIAFFWVHRFPRLFSFPLSPALSNHSAGLWAGSRKLRGPVSQLLKLRIISVAWQGPHSRNWGPDRKPPCSPEAPDLCLAPFL